MLQERCIMGFEVSCRLSRYRVARMAVHLFSLEY